MGIQNITLEEAKKHSARNNTINHPHDDPRGIHSMELWTFRREVERAMRGAKTMVRTSNTAYVYMDDDPYVLGWIGYGDFQTSKNGKHKYVVYSRDIDNCKYSEGKEQHYMRMALNMGTAVKHAGAELRSYSPSEVSYAASALVRGNVHRVKDEAYDAYTASLEALGFSDSYKVSKGRGDTVRELISIFQSGHAFSPEVHTKMEDVIAKKKIADRFPKRGMLPMDFIRVYEKFGKQYMDKVAIADMYNYHNTRWTSAQVEVSTLLMKDVDEELQGKIAVMGMCADKQFVEDVGYKASDAMFYFYTEDTTT